MLLRLLAVTVALLAASVCVPAVVAQPPNFPLQTYNPPSPSFGYFGRGGLVVYNDTLFGFGGISFPEAAATAQAKHTGQAAAHAGADQHDQHSHFHSQSQLQQQQFNGVFSLSSPSTSEWQWDVRATAPWKPRSALCSGVIGDQLYMYGGQNFGSMLYDLWQYSPEQDTWTELSASTFPAHVGFSSSFNCGFVGGALFVFGGYGDGNGTNLVARYALESATWTVEKAPWSPREPTAVFDGPGALYVFGSGFPTPSTDLWEFDGVTWTELSPSAPFVQSRTWVFAGVPQVQGGEQAIAFDYSTGHTWWFSGAWEDDDYGATISSPVLDLFTIEQNSMFITPEGTYLVE